MSYKQMPFQGGERGLKGTARAGSKSSVQFSTNLDMAVVPESYTAKTLKPLPSQLIN